MNLQEIVKKRRQSLDSLNSLKSQEIVLLQEPVIEHVEETLEQKIQRLIPSDPQATDIFDTTISPETVIGHGSYLYRQRSEIDLVQLQKQRNKSDVLYAIEHVLDDVNAFIEELEGDALSVGSVNRAPSVKSVHVIVMDSEETQADGFSYN